MMPRDYQGVAIAAPVTVPYTRYSIHGAAWWVARALVALADSAGVSARDFDGITLSSFSLGFDPPIALTQHLGLTPRLFDQVALGGASAVVALRRAARAVQAGDADLVAVVAADTSSPHAFRRQVEQFSRFSTDAAYPYGAGGPNAPFALITDAYMRATGARREDFGRICVAQRENARAVPHALLRSELTMESYLAARPIADPHGMFDCVMPSAGAEAFVVLREADARARGLPHALLRGAVERHNAFAEDPMQLRGGWDGERATLYGMAGCRPEEISFLETYDDYPVIVMLQLEGLGFCPPGGAAEFVRAHDLRTQGNFPHNTSGGQLSCGQAGAAGGHLGLVEALRQIIGQPLGAAVADSRLGLVSGFGMVNYDRGLASAAAILAAP